MTEPIRLGKKSAAWSAAEKKPLSDMTPKSVVSGNYDFVKTSEPKGYKEVQLIVKQLFDHEQTKATGARLSKGAPWEDIVSLAGSRYALTETQVEECLNRMMDEGLAHEPVLGRLVPL